MLYVFLIRLALSLLLAFWALRRLRAPLRGLIVRAMPLKMRMSENALAKQARISNIVGISVWLMLAVPLYLLFRPIALVFGGKDKAPGEQVEIAPLPYRQPLPEPPSHTAPVSPPPPELVPEYTEAALPALPPPAPAIKPSKGTAPAPAPMSYAFAAPQPYYLQLGAFRELSHAWDARYSYATRLEARVWIGHQVAGSIPYKVLIGPFEGRAQAEAFRRHYRLKGFPRPLEDIRLYQD